MRAPTVLDPTFDPEAPVDADGLRLLLTPEAHEVSRVVVPGMLHASVGIQRGEQVAPASAHDLARLSLGRAAAWRDARARARRTTRLEDLTAVTALPGLFLLSTEDGLAASRLPLLPEILQPVPFGGLVAAVPTASQLLVAPLASPKDLSAVRGLVLGLAQIVETVGEPLSDQLFWYDGARWSHVPVNYDAEDVTVRPTPRFLRALHLLAAVGLVAEPAEA